MSSPSLVERTLRRFDAYQQQHGWIGFPFAVMKKFGDDRGGSLAALLAYYGTVSLFPLLLVATTILGILVGNDHQLEQRVLHSALADFPIIGVQLQSNVHSLRGTSTALVVGLVAAIWGGLAVTQAAQHAMNQIWNVPGVVRPGFLSRLGRGLFVLVLLGAGVVGTTVLSGLATLGGRSATFRIVNLSASTLLNVALFMVAFRLLTAASIPTRPLLPGAVSAGIAWQLLQSAGGYLVAHQLRHASQVYGFFAVVLGLLSWLYLASQVTLYAAEFNVVRARRLWPRSLLQPPLTLADKATLGAIAMQEERRPEQSIDVTFE